MPVTTGPFNSYAGGSGAWTNVSGILGYDLSEAYVTFSAPAGVGYVLLYNWSNRDEIPDGSTINSILIKCNDSYNKSTDPTPGKFGINFDGTDTTTNRHLTTSLNIGTPSDKYIPTGGVGDDPDWWVSGWSSADILSVIKKTTSSGAMRLYGIGSATASNRLFIGHLNMTVDYTLPGGGAALLGGF